jgi:HSP20 family protein
MNLRSLLPFGEQKPLSVRSSDTSPFISLQREIDRVFDEFSHSLGVMGGAAMPRIDVIERDGAIEITAEMPGMTEKDVEVTLADDILTLRGEKKATKEEGDEKRRVIERSYGAFSRSLELPAGIDPAAIEARMADGVLTVRLPKPAAPAASARKIDVKPAQ